MLGQLCFMNGEMDETGYKLFLETYKHFNLRELKTSDLKINQEQLQEFSSGLLQNWLGNFG